MVIFGSRNHPRTLQSPVVAVGEDVSEAAEWRLSPFAQREFPSSSLATGAEI